MFITVGNDSAVGAPVLVTGRDNGRGPYFGRNFSSPKGAGTHTPGNRGVGPARVKKSACGVLKFRRFMCAAFEQGPSFAEGGTSSSLLDSHQTTRREGGFTPRRMSNP